MKDLLGTLDYGGAADDACRMRIALERSDPHLCAALSLAALRDGCQSRLAMAAGRPEACPNAPTMLGRDPVCVAVAARRETLCAAAPAHDAVRCSAIARRHLSGCDGLDPSLRERCRADVTALSPTRWEMSLRPLVSPRLQIRVGDVQDAGPMSTWQTATVQRGAVLTPDGKSVLLVDPVRGWPSEFTLSRDGRDPVVAFWIDLSGPVPSVRAARVVLPDGRVLAPNALIPAQITLEPFRPERSATIRGRIALTMQATGWPSRVEVDVATFVRDLLPVETPGLFPPPAL